MKKNVLFLSAAIGWWALTAILLTLPGSAFPKEDWLSKIWFDKWVHIGLFAVWVFCWCRVLQLNFPHKKNRMPAYIFVGLAGLAYGTGMEFVQKNCIPNRSFDIGDIIADGVGALAGVILGLRYIKK